MADLTQLKRTTKRSYRRVGRGQSSTRGKTSGRGGKGQTARAGHKIRPEFRDIIKKLSKRRGYGKNRARSVNNERVLPVIVTLDLIEAAFPNGGDINPKILVEAGVVSLRRAVLPKIKILVGGDFTKKIFVSGCDFSSGVRSSIEKLGGTITK